MKNKAPRILFFLFWCHALYGDTILLKNGSRIEGEIVGQTRKIILIRVKGKEVKKVDKTVVRRVLFAPLSEENPHESRLTGNDRQKLMQLEEQVTELRARLIRYNKFLSDSLLNTIGEEAPASSRETEAKTDEALRYAVYFPGWGHFRTGDKVSSGIYSGLFMLGLGYAASQNNEVRLKKEIYDDASRFSMLSLVGGPSFPSLFLTLQQLRARKNYSQTVSDYNRTLQALAAIYVTQLFHLALTGEKEETDASETNFFVGVRTEQKKNTDATLEVTVRF